MPTPPIRFGTDGWRAVIAEGFTFERLGIAAQASAQVLARTYPGAGIVVGYDNRFLSEQFAAHTAEVVASLGIPVYLSACAAPTPAFSWAAKEQGCHGALVITASHNPAHYSGLKVKGGFGGSVPPEVTTEIEQEMQNLSSVNTQKAPIQSWDPWPSYVTQLSRFVDLDALKKSPAKIWVDAMFGSGSGGLTRLLGNTITELQGYRDPLFGGVPPEPLPQNLRKSSQVIAADPAPLKIGLVFDGDADRIAAIDGHGNFLSPQILIPILIDHLAGRRGLRGEIVKTISGSELFVKVAEYYGLPITEMPVGFKYIAERMMSTEVLLGGEESGGIGYLGHIPERDALLSGLYLIEAVTETKQDLSEIYQTLQERAGFTSVYQRRDLHLTDQTQQTQVLKRLHVDPPAEILGQNVVKHFDQDGHKFTLANSSWVMIRGSGTEPLLRLYAEAQDIDSVNSLLDWASEIAKGSAPTA
ncbi:phosphoglucomutase/phosphomannomutase family protein [Thermostichus vulcanus]|uniref:Phosphoglucomutase/phosphomannomutase family protein n=1 Tax=Thermostichus vulcanus str. 'Rupite' TaxID=2813851 RepID=A0ABT0CC65_THEVL|nr:phosphoglucomutase/phosphomannomutase family protein [Thermostichus vulcanus]MCJ2543350.1 phosphoglucomutase/phosphomannomutase family protein [Thermostichus vulcanus str. 'Rupite']